MMNIQTFDGLLKKKNDIISTANNEIQNQLWWKHEIFHRLYLKYFVNDKEFNKKIKNGINEFEKDMPEQLIEVIMNIFLFMKMIIKLLKSRFVMCYINMVNIIML